MPKTKAIESALHDWVHILTFQQQALLMTGMRGPDGCNKHNPAKALTRYLRGAICKPAGNWSRFNDNDFMWGDYSVFPNHTREFFGDPDGYPHHYIMHLVHCAEVIGYKHVDKSIAIHWHRFYIAACKAFHMKPEMETDMDARLNDFGVPVTDLGDGKEEEDDIYDAVPKMQEIDDDRLLYAQIMREAAETALKALQAKLEEARKETAAYRDFIDSHIASPFGPKSLQKPATHLLAQFPQPSKPTDNA